MNCKWQSRFSFQWLCEEVQVTPYRDRLANGDYNNDPKKPAAKEPVAKKAETPKRAYTRTTK